MRTMPRGHCSLLALPRREFLRTGARPLGAAALASAGPHWLERAAAQDRMDRWGATVRATDREAILNYLATHFSPPAKPAEKQKNP